MKLQNNPTHKFNVDRKDFYKCNSQESNAKTKERLIEIADMGMEEVMTAEFGFKDIMSGLYIEKVWSYSNEKWKEYIDWAKSTKNNY